MTDEQRRKYDRVSRRGWALLKGELLLAGPGPSPKPGWFLRRRLRAAMTCFEAALRIAPDSWQSLWAMGKIHQRLGETPEAFGCFRRAHQLAPSQPDVAREAGIAASDLGDGPAAVQFTKAAIAAKPEDPGLVANLAIAHLINGEVEQAQLVAAEATSRAPNDPVSRAVRHLVNEVAEGRRPRPRTMRDLGKPKDLGRLPDPRIQ